MVLILLPIPLNTTMPTFLSRMNKKFWYSRMNRISGFFLKISGSRITSVNTFDSDGEIFLRLKSALSNTQTLWSPDEQINHGSMANSLSMIRSCFVSSEKKAHVELKQEN